MASNEAKPKVRQGRPSIYEDAKGQIREAALALFAESGFDATSVGDIAKKAGVPKANVLYYFGDKEELWKNAVDHHWEEIDVYYADTLPQPMPVTIDGLALLISTYLKVCRKYPPYVQLPNLEGHAETWRTSWLANKHLKRHTEAMKAYFLELVEAKVVPEMDPVFFQTILTGGGQLLIGQHQLWNEATGIDPQASTFINDYTQSMMTILETR